MSLALTFLGGAPFQLLCDGVRFAIHSSSNFRIHLRSLEFTLNSLQARVIEEIRLQNLQLNLPVQQIEDLRRKMDEGIVLVDRLSKLSMWNIRIWGNCCNCIKPDYAHQLDELNEALRVLLETLRLESLARLNEISILARLSRDRQDELGQRQLQILNNQQYIIDVLSTQQQVIERIERNGLAALNGNQGAAAPVQAFRLLAIFRTLYDTVIQVNVKTVMFKRLLEDFKFTLDCLRPLIEDIAECRKLPLRAPKEEIESFIIVMERGVKLIGRCSGRSQQISYRKYEYINKLFALDETLQTLVNILKLQIEEDVREVLVSVSNLEKEIKEIEESGLLQHQYEVAVAGDQSPEVGLEVNDMPVTRDEIMEIEESGSLQHQYEVAVAEDQSPEVGLEVDDMSVTRDVKETLDSAMNIEVGVERIERSCLPQNQIEVAVAELSSPTVAHDVINMQETLDWQDMVASGFERKGDKETSDSGRSTEVGAQPIEGKEETVRSLPPQKNLIKSLEGKGLISKTMKHQMQKLYETSEVFDGHGGTDAATFIRNNILRFIVEDSHFPTCLERAIKSAYVKADHAFADASSLDISSGTTALTALISGRNMIIANAGDCRAVMGKRGRAIDMSKDHRPNSASERLRIEKLGGMIDDGYLNGQLSVSRALGDWHMKGSKGSACPLTAKPELQETSLTEEDEFLIMGCDGLWDVMNSQNAVTMARKELMIHNDPERCSRELVREALKRATCDNLTVIVVCFSPDAPPRIEIPQRRSHQRRFVIE